LIFVFNTNTYPLENKPMCLHELKRGEQARVGQIADSQLRTQLLRFGIVTGSEVRCLNRIPFGPIVLRYGGQELALGRDLARRIEIIL
jgi:Fe2+ transport system protein FeoA